MANKLFLLSATLAFFFLLTNASIYRTVVEFDEDDATNQMGPFGPKQKCRKEFRQAEHLVACQQWIHRQGVQPGGGPSWALEGEFDFEDDMENQQGPQERPQLLQQCCTELHQEDPDCVCRTLKRAAKAVESRVQQGQQQQGQPREVVKRIFKTARHLPNVCRVPQVGVCPFKARPSIPSYY